MKDVKEIFKDRLIGLMQEKSLNTISLGKETGSPSSSISNWIQMRRTVNVESLIIFANFFDCTVDYLLGLEE